MYQLTAAMNWIFGNLEKGEFAYQRHTGVRGHNLKCIWNEIFDNNFIVLLESALKDNLNAVYRL